MKNQRPTPTKGSAITPALDTKGGRLTVEEVAKRLNVGRLAVYVMLRQGIIPGVRVGRRWIITRHAYDEWERTCGMRLGTGLGLKTEVIV